MVTSLAISVQCSDLHEIIFALMQPAVKTGACMETPVQRETLKMHCSEVMNCETYAECASPTKLDQGTTARKSNGTLSRVTRQMQVPERKCAANCLLS